MMTFLLKAVQKITKQRYPQLTLEEVKNILKEIQNN